jgi:DNA polymerase-3 subunit epsilon
MNRYIFLGLNTTGYNPELGDRIVEIFCVETIEFIATGQIFHRYINTNNSVIKLAKDGLLFTEISNYRDFFSNKPTFREIADPLIKFLSHSSNTKIIVFDSDFEVIFLKSELDRLGMTIPVEIINISKLLFIKNKNSNIFFIDIINEFVS